MLWVLGKVKIGKCSKLSYNNLVFKLYFKILVPPTSVIIQSGIARLTIAKTSAAMKSVPDITVSLSILQKISLLE